jgi:transglutaminase-like putative cysteine protease/uncharacterized alpha-E superfamily protein
VSDLAVDRRASPVLGRAGPVGAGGGQPGRTLPAGSPPAGSPAPLADRPALLSRLADAVYWFGRYLTRAAGVAQVVAVHGETHLDLPVGADVGWTPLLAMTGTEAAFAERHTLLLGGASVAPGAVPTEDEVIPFVLCDGDNPSSVLASLRGARANARTARAVLPAGTWVEVSELWRTAQRNQAAVRDRAERAAWLATVRASCDQIAAEVERTTADDDAAAFFTVGQQLERADLAVRVLLARVDSVVAGLAVAPYADVHRRAVLRMVGAADAYRRVVSWDPGQAAVVRFLLGSDQFSGSVRSSLSLLAATAARWPATGLSAACTTALERTDAAAGSTTADVEQVRRALSSVQVALGEVHGAVSRMLSGAGQPTAAAPAAGDAPERRPAPVGRHRPGGPARAGRATRLGLPPQGATVGGRPLTSGTARRPAVLDPAVGRPAGPPGVRRYRVVHRTRYRYEDVAVHSYDEAHLRPRDTDRQRVFSSDLRVEPAPAMQASYLDRYGNEVWTFVVDGEFRELVVTATSEVELRPQPVPRRTPPWETAVRLLELSGGREAQEARRFRAGSRRAPISPELAAYAAASFPAKRPLLGAVLDLVGRIHREFEYQPGATTVTTPVREVLATRRGVCQDFAHLAIGCLRSMGLAARYVSGYIETVAPPGAERLVGADASHAWVGVHVPGWGWLDVDPTNDQVVSLSHVTVAWGRDYDDVAPLRGTVAGGGSHELEVAVDVARVRPDQR